MTRNSSPVRWIVVCLFVATAGRYYFHRSNGGEELFAQSAAQRKTERSNDVMGVDTCVRCHLAGLPKSTETPSLFQGFASGADNWIRYDEIKIWATSDKHSQAYSVLLGEQARKMGRLLGVSEIHRDKRCLACHSGYPLHEMQTDEAGLVSEELAHDRRLTLGVGCEGCHGNAGKWYEQHLKKEWRTRPAAEKSGEYGFYDIHSPEARAELCATCHIGSVKQGRIVTHEMYAAGHPPLGAFEIESYQDQMPVHFNRFASKDPKLIKDYCRQTGLQFDPKELHRTKAMLIGSVVSFRESLKLTADLADKDVHSPIAKPPWPELAQFACFACHHDLKENSWRRNRSLPVTPGRPLPHEWPIALLDVALQQAGEDRNEFQARHNAVLNVFSQRPFGDPSELNGPMRSLNSLLDQISEKLADAKLDRADGLKILQTLSETGAKQTLDYDGARQLAWAFRVVLDECRSSAEVTANSGDARIEDILNRLQNHLTLSFNKDRNKTLERTFPKETAPRQYGEIPLDKTLSRIAEYDPQMVKNQFAEISNLLKSR